MYCHVIIYHNNYELSIITKAQKYWLFVMHMHACVNKYIYTYMLVFLFFLPGWFVFIVLWHLLFADWYFPWKAAKSVRGDSYESKESFQMKVEMLL